MDWMVQWLQARRNRIHGPASASGGFLCLSSYMWINKLYFFTEVTSIFRFKPLCWFCVIPGLSPFIDLVTLLYHTWPLLAFFLCHQIFNNRYDLCYVMGNFSFILSTSYLWMENWSGVPGFLCCWVNLVLSCYLNVSGSVIYLPIVLYIRRDC